MPFWEHLRRALEHVMDSIMARIWGVREPGGSRALALEGLTERTKRLLDRVKALTLRLEKMRDEYRKLAEGLVGKDREFHLSLIRGLAELEEIARESIKKVEELMELLRSLDRTTPPDEEALERIHELFYEVQEFIIEHFAITDDFRAIPPV